METPPNQFRWVESAAFKTYRRSQGDAPSAKSIGRVVATIVASILLGTAFLFFNNVIGMLFLAVAMFICCVVTQSLVCNRMSTPSELKSGIYRRDCDGKTMWSPRFDLTNCKMLREDQIVESDQAFWCIELMSNRRRLLLGFDHKEEALIVKSMLKSD